MSDESDGDEDPGELSGEVQSILNSRTGVQRGVRFGNSHGGTATRQRYDDPSEFRVYSTGEYWQNNTSLLGSWSRWH